MAAGVRQVVIRFAGETKGLKKATGQAGKQMDTWRDKMKRFNRVAVAGSLAVGAGMAALGKDMVGLSRELSDLDAKNKAVFEDQLGPMREWAEQNKAAFGKSRDQVVGLAANMADLLKPMGFTAEEAAGMSQEMLDLSGALSKWSGGTHDAAQVSEILSKAMLGEREQLKSLGISITEADVKARLAKKGQEELTGAALQQAKAVATQELILEKSTDAQAAWAEGGREAAEAENAHTVAIQEARESLARALTPAIEKGTKMLASFAGWATRNRGIVLGLGIAVAGLATAVLAINAAIKVWRAGVIVATAAQWAWNVALNANPIGLIVLGIAALIAIVVLLVVHWDTVKKAFQVAWGWIWDKLKAFGAWVKATFWENGLKKVFDAHIRVVNLVRDKFAAAFGRMRDRASAVLSFMRSIPGKIKSGFSSVFRIITSPFRAAFNAISGFWNRTIGGRGFEAPSWVPFGVGGKSFKFPTFPRLHSGGLFRAPPGRSEGLALLRDRERVLTPEQQAGVHIDNVTVQAWSDRFSLPQVMSELAFAGAA